MSVGRLVREHRQNLNNTQCGLDKKCESIVLFFSNSYSVHSSKLEEYKYGELRMRKDKLIKWPDEGSETYKAQTFLRSGSDELDSCKCVCAFTGHVHTHACAHVQTYA